MLRRIQFAVATVIVTAVIIYGSLYPFTFRPAVEGIDPAVRALIESWAEPPSRTDLIANILLYMPFGFFAVLALSRNASVVGRVVWVTLIGGMLSISMELAQYFDADRVTNASDVYTNSFGALIGAIGGSFIGGRFRWPLLAQIAAARVPMLILVAWIGYRLYPYVPTIDVHKYWSALKPLILYPSLTGYDLFRYTAIWLTISALIEAILGAGRAWVLFPLFVGCVLVGKVMIVDTSLSVAEVTGAALAIVVRGLLAFNASLRITLIALAFYGYVVADRLEPFQFSTIARPFVWTPFLGFMSGDLRIDILSFLEKFFLYGAAIWLLTRAGLRLGTATLLIALTLFVTSQAERFLPGRSAEVTDAIMALLIGAIFALIRNEPSNARESVRAN